MYHSVLHHSVLHHSVLHHSVLRRVVVCYNVSQCVAEFCIVLQSAAVRLCLLKAPQPFVKISVLQCVAECNVSHFVGMRLGLFNASRTFLKVGVLQSRAV